MVRRRHAVAAPLLALVLLSVLVGVVGACTTFGLEEVDGGADASEPQTDARPPLEAGSGFCADKPDAFCDDFERADAADVKGPWSEKLASTGNATLVIATDFSASPSGSLRVSFPAGPASGQALALAVGQATTALSIGFAMRLEELPGIAGGNDDYVQLVAVRFAGSEIYLAAWKDGGFQVVEQRDGTVTHATLPGAGPFNQFVRYQLEVDTNARTATFSSEKATVTLPLTLGHSLPSSIKLGNSYANARKKGGYAWFDDVVIRTR